MVVHEPCLYLGGYMYVAMLVSELAHFGYGTVVVA